jgi:hypothetical protein
MVRYDHSLKFPHLKLNRIGLSRASRVDYFASVSCTAFVRTRHFRDDVN